MYEQFYNLKEKPFSPLPDPDFLYLGEQHRTALAFLRYGLQDRVGFTVITGEIGCGKTTLARYLLGDLDQDTRVGYVDDPHGTSCDIVESCLLALGIDYPNESEPRLRHRLVTSLVDEYERGRSTMLIVDEAQNMATEGLEELRTLSNVNTEKRQLLTLVLLGQPGLRELLRRPELEQFAQRIAVHYHLEPLSETDTVAYIRHRLGHAGGDPELFTATACRIAYRASHGVPRLINRVCDMALVHGYGNDKLRIDVSLVVSAAQDASEGGLIAPPEGFPDLADEHEEVLGRPQDAALSPTVSLDKQERAEVAERLDVAVEATARCGLAELETTGQAVDARELPDAAPLGEAQPTPATVPFQDNRASAKAREIDTGEPAPERPDMPEDRARPRVGETENFYPQPQRSTALAKGAGVSVAGPGDSNALAQGKGHRWRGAAAVGGFVIVVLAAVAALREPLGLGPLFQELVPTGVQSPDDAPIEAQVPLKALELEVGQSDPQLAGEATDGPIISAPEAPSAEATGEAQDQSAHTSVEQTLGERITTLREASRNHETGGDFSAALAVIDEALGLDPSDASLGSEKQRLGELLAEKEQQAALANELRQKVDRLLQDAERTRDAGDLESAMVLAKRARELDSSSRGAETLWASLNVALIEQRERARQAAARRADQLRAAVTEATKQLRGGNLEAAGRVIRDGRSIDAEHAPLRELETQLEAALAERARQAELAARRKRELGSAVTRAAAQLQQGDLDAAATQVQAGLSIDPEYRPLQELQSRVEKALAEREREKGRLVRRQRQLEKAVTQAKQQLQQGNLAAAAVQVQSGLSIDAENAELLQLQRELDAASAARTQAIEKNRRRLEIAVSLVQRQIKGGNLENAHALIRSALAIDPTFEPLLVLQREVDDAFARQERQQLAEMRLSAASAVARDRASPAAADAGGEPATSARSDQLSPPGPSEPPKSSKKAQEYLRKGDELLQIQDVASARLFYEVAAEEGDTSAMIAVASTYDPVVLKARGLRTQSNAVKAAKWYVAALENGNSNAIEPLDALRVWSSEHEAEMTADNAARLRALLARQ